MTFKVDNAVLDWAVAQNESLQDLETALAWHISQYWEDHPDEYQRMVTRYVRYKSENAS